MAATLALHAAAGWGLLQVDAVRSAVAEAAPLFVDLIAPPSPERPPEPPAPPPPSPAAKTPPQPAPVIAAAPAPLPALPTFVAPEPPPEPAPSAPTAVPVVVALAAPAPPASVPPPAARELPASAIQYLEPPEPAYPRASRRAGESGLVVVRVFVGADGLPRQLQLLQSSGFARLDEAALEGVRRARFKPPTENGQPIAGWARIPIPFELEKQP